MATEPSVIGQDERVPLAWWLVPQAEAAQRLSGTIEALAQQVGGPVFEPHVTVAMSQLPLAIRHGIDRPALQRALQARLAPIHLRPLGLGHGPRYFQSIFLRLAEQGAPDPYAAEKGAGAGGEASGPLARMVLSLSEVLDAHWPSGTQPPAFEPHLSLCYGELEQVQREALIVDIEPVAESIVFDSLVAVAPRPGVSSLAKVADWEVILRLSLAKSS